MADTTTPAGGGRCGSGDKGSAYTRNISEQSNQPQAALIAAIEKNSREVLRLEMTAWCGHHFLSARYWYLAENGELKPGKQGISLRYTDLPKIIEALRVAHERASGRGLA